VYARLPKVHSDESRTHGLDRLELIRFLQVAQTITVHHGALAYLLGINALRASEVAAVRVEDYAQTMRGHRVLHLVGKGDKPATMPLTVPVLRVLQGAADRRERLSRIWRLGTGGGKNGTLWPHYDPSPKPPTPRPTTPRSTPTSR
jgi:integrase